MRTKIFIVIVCLMVAANAIALDLSELKKILKTQPEKSASICRELIKKAGNSKISLLNQENFNSQLQKLLELCIKKQTVISPNDKKYLAIELSSLLLQFLNPKYRFSGYNYKDDEYWFRTYLWGYVAKHSNPALLNKVVNEVFSFVKKTPFKKEQLPKKWSTNQFVNNVDYLFYFLSEAFLFKEAEKLLKIALESGYYKEVSSSYHIYRDLIKVYKYQGLLDQAEKLIIEVKRKWSTHKNKHQYVALNIHLAGIYIATNRQEQALELLEKFSPQVKENGKFWVAWQNMQTVIIDIQQKNFKRALEKLDVIEKNYGKVRGGIGLYHTYLMKAGIHLYEKKYKISAHFLALSEKILIDRAFKFSAIHYHLMKALYSAGTGDAEGFRKIQKDFQNNVEHTPQKEKFRTLFLPITTFFNKKNKATVLSAIEKRKQNFQGFPYTYLHDPILYFKF